MLITDLDKIIFATEAAEISSNNKDESCARTDVRDFMERIRFYASYGHTQATEYMRYRNIEPDAKLYLENLGYKVQVDSYPEPLESNPSRMRYTVTVSWGG